MIKGGSIFILGLLITTCFLAPNLRGTEQEGEEEEWNSFQLSEDLSLSFNGDFYVYHIRNHNSYYKNSNASWTEVTARFGVDLEFREEFSGQFRVAGTGLFGRPENFLRPDPLVDPGGAAAFDSEQGEMDTLVDLANLTWHTQLFDRNLDVTVGVQELKYGDGFLVMDGYTESRAIWTSPITSFPAIKGSWNVHDGMEVDLFAAHVRRNHFTNNEAFLGEGRGFPAGGSLVGGNLHWDEWVEGNTMDFGIFRKEEDSDSVTGSDTTAITLRNEFHFEPVTLTAEIVRQYGETRVINSQVQARHLNRRAWGGHLTARVQITDEGIKPYVKGRYVYFAGDEASSSRSEAFDPMFYGWDDWGQWWLGDMTSYQVYNTNSHVLVFETGGELTDFSKLRFLYYRTDLDEKIPSSQIKSWSHEFNVVYDYTFNEFAFCGVMTGAALPREGAKNFNGKSKTNYNLIGWIGFSF